jgi:hypothetical protein
LNTIAQLNDSFRKSFIGGRVMLSHDVASLDAATRAMVLTAVATFDTFTDDNDPHHEHDFGAVTVKDETYFFKLDYYDVSMEFGSDDPANPKLTTRVMTIMHRSEY